MKSWLKMGSHLGLLSMGLFLLFAQLSCREQTDEEASAEGLESDPSEQVTEEHYYEFDLSLSLTETGDSILLGEDDAAGFSLANSAANSDVDANEQKLTEIWRTNMTRYGEDILEQLRTDPRAEQWLRNPASMVAEMDLLKNDQLYHDTLYRLQPQKGTQAYSLRSGNVSKALELEAPRLRYMTAVAAVAWAIHARAKADQSGAKSGAYGVTDPDGLARRFTLGYAAVATKAPFPADGLGEEDMLRFIEKHGTSHIYNRDPDKLKSSHLKDPALKSRQAGIDFRLDEGRDSLAILPNGRKHLMIGDYDLKGPEVKTYFKFESVGIGNLRDKLAHGKNFILHVLKRGKGGESRRESDIPKKVIDDVAKEAPYYHKLDSKKPLALQLQAISDPKKANAIIEATQAAYTRHGYDVDVREQLGSEWRVKLPDAPEKGVADAINTTKLKVSDPSVLAVPEKVRAPDMRIKIKP